MTLSFPRYPVQLLVGAMLLAIALLAGPFTMCSAGAQLSSCRSDPVVTLSDGTQIDLSADIDDSPSDVVSILYTLHAPVGTHVVATATTDGELGLVERFRFNADTLSNTYDTDTVVNTRLGTIPVTATTTVVSVLGVTVGWGSTVGTSGQDLLVHIPAA